MQIKIQSDLTANSQYSLHWKSLITAVQFCSPNCNKSKKKKKKVNSVEMKENKKKHFQVCECVKLKEVPFL